VLLHDDGPTHCYSSHMPQIIEAFFVPAHGGASMTTARRMRDAFSRHFGLSRDEEPILLQYRVRARRRLPAGR
jgi:hypothetical protein